jgi:AsmA family
MPLVINGGLPRLNKRMLKKTLTGIGIFLLLLALGLVIVPLAFKNQINNWVKNQINTGINARVDYAGVSITCFKNFPDVDVSLQNLSVTGDSLFDKDTLASIENFGLTLDIHSLLSGSQYKILQCNMERPQFNFRADSTGQVNWHIFKKLTVIPGQGVITTADSSHVTLQIDHYKVIGASISYRDEQRKFVMLANNMNVEGNVQSSVIQSRLQLASLSVSKGGSQYLDHMQLNASLLFSLAGDSLLLDTLSATLGRNDLQGGGEFNHILASQMGKAVFAGQLTLQSHYFDLNNWLQSNVGALAKKATTQAPVKNQTATPPVNNTPSSNDSVDVNLWVTFDTVVLNKLLLQQARAHISVHKDSVAVSDFACNLLGGSATANVQLVHQHDMRFQFSINHCDIQRTSGAVPVTGKVAPAAQYIHGSFSAELKAKGRLNDGMNLDYNTLDGEGKIQLSKSTITQVPVLADVGKLAKNANLSNLEMNPVTSVIRCKNSLVTVEPTDIKFTNGFALNVKGTNTFNGDINYNMMLSVPTKQMGGIANLAQSFLSGIGGLNLKVPDFMTFSFNVTGTFTKPQAKLVNMGTQ